MSETNENLSLVQKELEKMLKEAKVSRENGLLDRKNTNINIRCSLSFKAFIIEKAGEMGLTISDFVEYCIGRSELVLAKESEIKGLKKNVSNLEKEIEKETETNEALYNDLALEHEKTSKELDEIKEAFAPLLERMQKNGGVKDKKGEFIKPKSLTELAVLLLNL